MSAGPRPATTTSWSHRDGSRRCAGRHSPRSSLSSLPVVPDVMFALTEIECEATQHEPVDTFAVHELECGTTSALDCPALSEVSSVHERPGNSPAFWALGSFPRRPEHGPNLCLHSIVVNTKHRSSSHSRPRCLFRSLVSATEKSVRARSWRRDPRRDHKHTP